MGDAGKAHVNPLLNSADEGKRLVVAMGHGFAPNIKKGGLDDLKNGCETAKKISCGHQIRKEVNAWLVLVHGDVLFRPASGP
jgi:hypothetical protein